VEKHLYKGLFRLERSEVERMNRALCCNLV